MVMYAFRRGGTRHNDTISPEENCEVWSAPNRTPRRVSLRTAFVLRVQVAANLALVAPQGQWESRARLTGNGPGTNSLDVFIVNRWLHLMQGIICSRSSAPSSANALNFLLRFTVGTLHGNRQKASFSHCCVPKRFGRVPTHRNLNFQP
jgi:hypothetical protein